MLIFTVDARNRIGHPMKKFDMIGRLLRKQKVKIVKRYGEVILVRFLDRYFNESKTIDCEFRIGIDPGYKNIGFAVFKICKNVIMQLFSGEVVTRTSDVTGLLSERRMYRQKRRYNRRKNVKRKFKSIKFRKPIWTNRKKRKFQPTHKHLMNSHYAILKKIFKFIPVEQVKLHVEYCNFDVHRITSPGIRGWRYQKGMQYGFENVKSYVRHRDKFKCQICGKDISQCKSYVHHIIFRSKGGSDRPDNLITLCLHCHDAVHKGLVICPKPNTNFKYRDTGVLNSCMKKMFEILEKYFPVQNTLGSITKVVRLASNIEKTHANDAKIIAFCDSLGLQDIANYKWIDFDISINFKQYRRHVRTHTQRLEDRKYYIPGYAGNRPVAWNRRRRTGQDDKEKISLEELKRRLRSKNINVNIVAKVGGSVKRRSNTNVLFRPGDIIKVNNTLDICRGWASTQGKVILENLGKIPKRQCQKILNNSGMVFSCSSPG